MRINLILKAYFAFSLLFIFNSSSVLALDVPDIDFPDWQEKVQEATQKTKAASGEATVFSDPGYQNSTHNFSPGQMVYYRLEVAGQATQQRVLRVLDSQKNEVQNLKLSQQGSGPYIYTTSFSAPSQQGVYYVDVKINDGQGFSFSGQQNINVGSQGQGSKVEAIAESEVVVNGESFVLPTKVLPSKPIEKKVTLVPTFPKETKPTIAPEKPEKLVGFLGNFFEWLKMFFENLF